MQNRAALGIALALVIAVALYFAFRNSKSPEKTAASAVPSVKAPPRQALDFRRLPKADEEAKPKSDDRQTSMVFSAKWGGGPEELGRERPQEGNPQGPMSLGVDAKGRVYVLDEVNARIVRRGPDGKVDANIRVDMRNPEDLAVTPDGKSAVLDRFQDKSVTLYDDSGKLSGKLPLAGDGVPDTGSVTGVFVDKNDVYVEKEHGSLVKIGDISGIPADPRSEIPGRPSRDGLSFLNAGIIEAPTGRVYVSSIVRATGAHRFTQELNLGGFVRNIVLLDTDKAGVIYFGADVELGVGDEEVLLSCLDPTTGAPTGHAVIPANTMPEESFRDLVVLDGGGVVAALRTDQGVTYSKYYCQ